MDEYKAVMDQILVAVDTNKDGLLTKKEWIDAGAYEGDDRWDQLLCAVDKNKDEKLGFGEINAVWSKVNSGDTSFIQ